MSFFLADRVNTRNDPEAEKLSWRRSEMALGMERKETQRDGKGGREGKGLNGYGRSHASGLVFFFVFGVLFFFLLFLLCCG